MFCTGRFNGFKKGYSIAEVLLVIAIIGVIAAVTMPALKNAIPSKEETLHKKMTYIVERVVGQIYDDDVMYAKKSDLMKQGFQNVEKTTVNGVEYGGGVVGGVDKGATKFCELFATKFNKITNEVVCRNGEKSFTTTDNVDWYLPVTKFEDGNAEIMVDVNGSEGANCIEGSANCSKPDRFKYYIKPNGTVTLTEPANVVNDKFKIVVNVTNPEGGTYAIAKVNPNGTTGTFQTSSSYFKNLDRNTRYIIRAYPVEGYYTEWQLDQRRVTIVSSDVHVSLIFKPRSTYCVILNVKNCNEDVLTDCATYKINKGCNYVFVGERQGNYKLDTLGSYQFVGLGVDGGNYNYKCTGGSENMSIGYPTKEADDTITVDTTRASMHLCGLMTGDYRIKVTPKSTYTIEPEDNYEQDVRLGTDNLTFGIDLKQK